MGGSGARPDEPGQEVGRSLARGFVLLTVALGAFCLWRGWGKWPDVLVDFGRELYVPWRMVEGERLGVDLAWFNGPLSAHWNALLFRVFGVGLWTLAWANLVWLALVTWLLHRLLARVTTPLAAGAATCFFVVVFACGQLVPIGNYNFLAPYSHEVTHGFGLALTALCCLVGAQPQRTRLAGLLLGLVFLTKAELFVAGAAGALTLVALRARGEGEPRGVVARTVRLVSFAILPVAAAFALLTLELPAHAAATLTLGSWANLFDPRLTELSYYSRGMGLDEPLVHLGEIGVGLALALLAFGPGLLLARVLRARELARGPLVFTVALVFAATLAAWLLAPTTWRWLARLSPAAMLLLCAGALAVRGRVVGDERRRLGELVGVSVFALALLAKIVLQVRFGHYGFALAAPAACLLLAAAVACASSSAFGRRGGSAVAVAAILAVYVACGWDLWQRSEQHYGTKDERVGAGVDALWTDARGPFVRAALDEVRERARPGDEVLVLPEGILLNYLARRRTPTPFVNFMPPELILFGEAEILAALEARPPAIVVLAHKDTSEYGVPYFGRDYARSLGAWVLEHYRHRWTDPRGGPPLTPGTDFGISVLERKP